MTMGPCLRINICLGAMGSTSLRSKRHPYQQDFSPGMMQESQQHPHEGVMDRAEEQMGWGDVNKMEDKISKSRVKPNSSICMSARKC